MLPSKDLDGANNASASLGTQPQTQPKQTSTQQQHFPTMSCKYQIGAHNGLILISVEPNRGNSDSR